MNGQVRRTHARSAILCLPAEMARDTREEKYPAYVGLLIATGASALLWAIIGSVASALI